MNDQKTKDAQMKRQREQLFGKARQMGSAGPGSKVAPK